MKHLFTPSMAPIKRAFGLLSVWNWDRSFSSWLGMLRTTEGSTCNHIPHTLSKVFSESCSVRSVQDEGSEDKSGKSKIVFPYLSHLLPISLPLPLSFPPPHPSRSKVLQIALPTIFLTSFFLSSLLPHSLPFNSVSIFVSLFSMHCHSLVNFWILTFGSSFS